MVMLARYWDCNASIPPLAQALAKDWGVNGKIASQNRYRESLMLVYFMGGQYYNTPRKDWTEEITEKKLKELGVDYFIVWEGDGPPPHFCERYVDVTLGCVPELKAYVLHRQETGVFSTRKEHLNPEP
jgi:hypothetical protein